MENEWQLQEAKNKLSEVVNQALTHGPQLITRRGEKAAVLIAYTEYEKLCKAQGKISAFFQTSPLAENGKMVKTSPTSAGTSE